MLTCVSCLPSFGNEPRQLLHETHCGRRPNIEFTFSFSDVKERLGVPVLNLNSGAVDFPSRTNSWVLCPPCNQIKSAFIPKDQVQQHDALHSIDTHQEGRVVSVQKSLKKLPWPVPNVTSVGSTSSCLDSTTTQLWTLPGRKIAQACKIQRIALGKRGAACCSLGLKHGARPAQRSRLKPGTCE